MSRQPRQQSVTNVYHVIQRGINRTLIFFEDADRRMFLEMLKSQVCDSFEVYCYCLMDNHIHLIVKSGQLSFYIHRILTSYAIWFNRKYERGGYVFQNRFRSEVIEEEGYLLRCLRYFLQNPLKAGVCRRVSAYAWSSYRAYYGAEDSFVATGFLSLFFEGEEDFRAFVAEEEAGTFMDIGCRLKDCEVREVLKEMLEGRAFDVLDRVEQKRILKKLKQDERIGQRQLARITGIDLNMIRRL